MSLKQLIRHEIAATGPMRMDRYMSLCLMHPEFGYYMRRDPFGQKGDFTTAPEISQLFGEMIGLWVVQSWQDQGGPEATLVELGPGRGTLMADILRVGAKVPHFLDRTKVVLVEQSPWLRQAQKEALEGYALEWRADVAQLPNGPIFLIANEFFDALPIRQAEYVDSIWLERCVALDGQDLRPGHMPLDAYNLLKEHPAPRDGAVFEWSDAARRIAHRIGETIIAHGGSALFVDYGDVAGAGDTLQAVAKHDFTSILNDPGHADLSAHVNFGALARAAEPAVATDVMEQGPFLASAGIGQRAHQLAQSTDANGIADALERLTHPDKMGRLFKVMGLRSQSSPPLPILEAPC